MKENERGRAAQVFIALGKSLCYLALFLGMQALVALSAVIGIAMEAVLNGQDKDEAASYVLASLETMDTMGLTLIAGALTLAILLVFYLARGKKLGEALWLRPVPPPTLWAGAALAPGLYLAVSLVIALLLPEELAEGYENATSALSNNAVSVPGVLAVVAAAPIVEEIIFRGLILTRLSRAMPAWLAVVLSAALFGAGHSGLVWFCYAFVLGVVFALMDLRAGSILPSMLSHFVFNSIGQIFNLLPDGNDDAAVAAVGILLIAAIAAPLFDRRAVAAIFRPGPKAAPAPAEEKPARPRNYDYDPWDL